MKFGIRRKKVEEKTHSISEVRTLEDLKKLAEVHLFNLYKGLGYLEELTNSTESEIRELEDIIGKLESEKEDEKNKIEIYRGKIISEVQEELNTYKQKLEKIKMTTKRVLEKYRSVLETYQKEIILPYREVIKEAEGLKRKLKGIEKEMKSIESAFEDYLSKAKRFEEKKEMVIPILSKYARRSNIEEEAEWVAELLEEDETSLYEAIKIGREFGYSAQDLMPIMAAYGLKLYRYSKGIEEDKLKEIGVSKRELEDYIVSLGVNGSEKARRKILLEMKKR